MSNFTNEATKKKLRQELQIMIDSFLNVSTKLANFSKFEIYDNDIQIQASENNKVFLNQMIGKYTTLLDSKNIGNFVDLKKFENSTKKDKEVRKDKDVRKDKYVKEVKEVKKDKFNYPHDIEIKHFMVIEDLNEFDMKNGFKVKTGDVYTFMQILPENIKKLQDDGIKFYQCYNKHDEYKVPYLYHSGGENTYWIATDNYLYYVDNTNNLVIGEYLGAKQRWQEKKN